jgi:hypothetical protein
MEIVTPECQKVNVEQPMYLTMRSESRVFHDLHRAHPRSGSHISLRLEHYWSGS